MESSWFETAKITALDGADGVLHRALFRLEEPCEGQEDCGHAKRRQDRIARIAVVLGAVTVGDHDVLGARPGVALAVFGLGFL